MEIKDTPDKAPGTVPGFLSHHPVSLTTDHAGKDYALDTEDHGFSNGATISSCDPGEDSPFSEPLCSALWPRADNVYMGERQYVKRSGTQAGPPEAGARLPSNFHFVTCPPCLQPTSHLPQRSSPGPLWRTPRAAPLLQPTLWPHCLFLGRSPHHKAQGVVESWCCPLAGGPSGVAPAPSLSFLLCKRTGLQCMVLKAEMRTQ